MKRACNMGNQCRPPEVLNSGRRQTGGFTLIELMIVIAIIAVLAGIAYANYTDRVVNSRRAAATTCMMEHAQFLERAYTTNMTYLGPAIPGLGCVGDLAAFYTFSVPTRTATTFTVQAVPAGPQQRDTGCATLTLNQAGVRTVSGGDGVAACW